MRKGLRYYLVQSLTLLVIALLCFIGYTVTTSLTSSDKDNENLSYVSYEILSDNTMPVSNEKDNTTEVVAEKTIEEGSITRPYTAKDVTIGKNYYDYTGAEKNQEESIIYYEKTYIQNTGIDYTSKDSFDVNSIADGTVEKITEDDITGKTIKIKHNNNLISVYQSLKDIKIKENDKVTKGQILAKSTTNAIVEKLVNHLHFELYSNNVLLNPEDFFKQNKVE